MSRSKGSPERPTASLAGRDPSKPVPVRCTGHSSRTGQPCKRYAIAGGTVCPTHGGSAPQVKEAARLRVERDAQELLPKVRHAYARILDDVGKGQGNAAAGVKAGANIVAWATGTIRSEETGQEVHELLIRVRESIQRRTG